jgi:hypothetical protein
MPTLRIFISSPGDVIQERRRAELVVDKLARDHRPFFDIQSELWETEPMLASGHFQDNITPPAESDIVVLIVWSRLGTSLPEKTARPLFWPVCGELLISLEKSVIRHTQVFRNCSIAERMTFEGADQNPH